MTVTIARLLGSALFGGAALICLGFAVSLTYEAIAYATGAVPTISDITVQTVIANKTWALAWALIAGVIIGALAAHLLDWIP